MIKNLRLLLVVALMLLVPFRGAVAAAMLCPPASPAPAAPADAHAGHEHHHHEASDHDDGSERCHVCAAFCSMTPLLDSWPPVLPALAAAPARFAEAGAAATHFLADGQERPPRSR